jgi:hypothetical protein
VTVIEPRAIRVANALRDNPDRAAAVGADMLVIPKLRRGVIAQGIVPIGIFYVVSRLQSSSKMDNMYLMSSYVIIWFIEFSEEMPNNFTVYKYLWYHNVIIKFHKWPSPERVEV